MVLSSFVAGARDTFDAGVSDAAALGGAARLGRAPASRPRSRPDERDRPHGRDTSTGVQKKSPPPRILAERGRPESCPHCPSRAIDTSIDRHARPLQPRGFDCREGPPADRTPPAVRAGRRSPGRADPIRSEPPSESRGAGRRCEPFRRRPCVPWCSTRSAPCRTTPSRSGWPRCPIRSRGRAEILVRVTTCGVCHTELDEIEGRTPPPRLPVILGHQAVGRVEAAGPGATAFRPGDRVGVAWIHSACGTCPRCRRGDENLCDDFRATGRDVPGGYAELMTVPEAFAHPIPDAFADAEAAPLLCAGAIGYRSLRLTGLERRPAAGADRLRRLGSPGPEAGEAPLSRPRRSSSSPGSEHERAFARELGAAWAGDTHELPPSRSTRSSTPPPPGRPSWRPSAGSRAGGRLVINAIRKEEATRRRCSGSTTRPTSGWRRRSRAWPTSPVATSASSSDLAAEIPIRPEVRGIPAGPGESGPRRAEGQEDPRRQGPADQSVSPGRPPSTRSS